jgi:divalent metal cation (Fe/Co/Zn/Cd) transporter
MKRVVALLTGLVLLATASLLGLYGLFAILYRGDSRGSGDTYVPLAGHDVNADLVGAVALLLGVVSSSFRFRSSGANGVSPDAPN